MCENDPRAARGTRVAHERRCGRWKHWWHGRHHHEGFGRPDAGDPTDFNLFEEENEDMGGRHHGHGREGWGFGGHRGHHRQPDRPLEQGDLRWLTLDLIAAQPRHGYEIIKAIADALHGQYSPSPGVIYPTLTLLEETGLIVGETQGAKKLYRLTDEGKTEVDTHAADIRAARARLAEAGARFGGSPAPELMRAMNNLRAALQVRLAKGKLSPEALNAITAALDRAAGEIERS
jgi:DNA-binding PadR family transcriptional regulator